MAGDWIKMEAATPDKPEVLAITARMGWDDPDLVVGKLFRVWRWFDQQTTDGNAKNVTTALLDRLIGVSGFADAMASVGWLIIESDGIQLPGFDKHCGNTAKNRAETAKRVASHRAKKGGSDEAPLAERKCLPRPIRAQVMDRDGRRCVYCGRGEGEYAPPEVSTAGVLHIDHVIPVTQGGSDDPLNLVVACSICNMFKGDRTPEECGLDWPLIDGRRAGNRSSVTNALPREEKRREEEKTKDGAAAPLSTDPVKDLFDRGVGLLGGEKSARSFLGKLRKQFGDAVVAQAIMRGEAQRPSDPVAWMVKACEGIGAESAQTGIPRDVADFDPLAAAQQRKFVRAA